MAQMHHDFTTFQKRSRGSSARSIIQKLLICATRGAYDAVMRSSIEEFVKSEDIDIDGDKPAPGVSNQATEQHSANLFQRACERVVNQIVDKRERIAKNLKDLQRPKKSFRNVSPNGCWSSMSRLARKRLWRQHKRKTR